MTGNGSAMVSTGIYSSELSVKQLAKAFYFIFFILKPNQKIWRTQFKPLNFGLSTKTRINYRHC